MAVKIQPQQAYCMPTWTAETMCEDVQALLTTIQMHPPVVTKPPTTPTTTEAPMQGPSGSTSQTTVPDDQEGTTKKTPKPSPKDNWDAASLAQWSAQMVCYLWLSPVESLSRVSDICGSPGSGDNVHSPGMPRIRCHSASVTPCVSEMPKQRTTPNCTHLYPTERFVSFVRNVLRVTQVSRSVITLGLLYIYRLKMRHGHLMGQTGSEYRLFITSLALANKFLDDHTYTNKTWSDVSQIPLKEITKMEMQLLRGIGTNANATLADYQWWQRALQLLDKTRAEDQRIFAWIRHTPLLSPSAISEPSIPTNDAQWHALSSEFERPYGYALESPLQRAADEGDRKRKRSVQSSVGEAEFYKGARPRIQATAPPQVRGPFVSNESTPQASVYTPSGQMLAAVLPDAHGMSGQMLADAFWRQNMPLPGAEHPACVPLHGRPGSDLELLLPHHYPSPYSTPHLQQSTSSPPVFQYYRLAAGYPHGIISVCHAPRGSAGKNQSLNVPLHGSGKADLFMSSSPLYTQSLSGTQENSPWSVDAFTTHGSNALTPSFAPSLDSSMQILPLAAPSQGMGAPQSTKEYSYDLQQLAPPLYDMEGEANAANAHTYLNRCSSGAH